MATTEKNSLPAIEANEGAGTGTVSRALSLLTLLAQAGGHVSVKQVVERMRVPPSTAHRLLQLLRKDGFVSVAAGSQYGIGPQFYRMAALVVASESPTSIAETAIRQIADLFNETVIFGLYLPTAGTMSFTARADGAHKLKYDIDMNRPQSLVWGASGKSILAHLPERLVDVILGNEGPSPADGKAKPSSLALKAELEEIRKVGWAVTRGEKLADSRGISAPVFGPAGVLGSITLTSPISRMPYGNIDDIGCELAARGKALSTVLGAKVK